MMESGAHTCNNVQEKKIQSFRFPTFCKTFINYLYLVHPKQSMWHYWHYYVALLI